jgi:hypothetical protein
VLRRKKNFQDGKDGFSWNGTYKKKNRTLAGGSGFSRRKERRDKA